MIYNFNLNLQSQLIIVIIKIKINRMNNKMINKKILIILHLKMLKKINLQLRQMKIPTTILNPNNHNYKYRHKLKLKKINNNKIESYVIFLKCLLRFIYLII